MNSTICKGDQHTFIFIIIGLINAKSAIIIYIYDSRFFGTWDSSLCDGGILYRLVLVCAMSNRNLCIEWSVEQGSVLNRNTRCRLL